MSITVTPAETDIAVADDYVVVKYDGKMYRGIVEEVINAEYRVSVLHLRKGMIPVKSIG